MSMVCIFALFSAVNEGVRDHLVRPFTWANGMLISPNKDEGSCEWLPNPIDMAVYRLNWYCMAIPRSW